MEIRLMSDYGWQLKCLESRLQHPEYYEKREDVTATVERLMRYLEENRRVGKTEGLYGRFLALIGSQRVDTVLIKDTKDSFTVKILKRQKKRPCSRSIYIELE